MKAKIIIASITKQILSCKTEEQINSVRRLIDQVQLSKVEKQVLLIHAAQRELGLPVIRREVTYHSMFGRQVGRKYNQYAR